MGTKTHGPDEHLALVVLQRVLSQSVKDNENGQQGRCDLKVIDVSGGSERTTGYVDATRLVGEDYARIAAMLGGTGGEVLRFRNQPAAPVSPLVPRRLSASRSTALLVLVGDCLGLLRNNARKKPTSCRT